MEKNLNKEWYSTATAGFVEFMLQERKSERKNK